eukprot:286674_1
MLSILLTTYISTTITLSQDTKVHEAGLPQSVSELFIAEKGICDSNSINSQLQNCWENYPLSTGQNHNYSPNKISFNGVKSRTLTTNNGNIKACCYNYKSVYMGNENCIGLPSIQSHLTFQIDCNENNYRIINTDASIAINYGLDHSTCYKGIQIDSKCDNECEYEICIQYLIDTYDMCPVINGWVLDKTIDSFSFNSLYGIPSCTLDSKLKHSNIDANIPRIFHTNFTVIFTQIIVVMFICMCGIFVYCSRNSISMEQYEQNVLKKDAMETDNECYQQFDNV